MCTARSSVRVQRKSEWNSKRILGKIFKVYCALGLHRCSYSAYCTIWNGCQSPFQKTLTEQWRVVLKILITYQLECGELVPQLARTHIHCRSSSIAKSELNDDIKVVKSIQKCFTTKWPFSSLYTLYTCMNIHRLHFSKTLSAKLQ